MITCNIATIGEKQLPENWDELNAEQYVAVFRSFAKPLKSDQEYLLDILLQWWETSAAKLAGLSWWQALKQQYTQQQVKIPTLLMIELQEEIFPAMHFVFDKIALCTKSHLQELKHNGVVYEGPSDKLLSVTGAEMEIAEYAYAAYIAQKRSRKFEILLCAALWRPKAAGFDKNKVAAIAEEFATLPDEVITGMRVFYEHCMRMWVARYPKVFKKGSEDSKPDPMAWRKLNRSMAGEKRGTVEQVQRMKLEEIFFELNELEKERRTHEEFIDKTKKQS